MGRRTSSGPLLAHPAGANVLQLTTVDPQTPTHRFACATRRFCESTVRSLKKPCFQSENVQRYPAAARNLCNLNPPDPPHWLSTLLASIFGDYLARRQGCLESGYSRFGNSCFSNIEFLETSETSQLIYGSIRNRHPTERQSLQMVERRNHHQIVVRHGREGRLLSWPGCDRQINFGNRIGNRHTNGRIPQSSVTKSCSGLKCGRSTVDPGRGCVNPSGLRARPDFASCRKSRRGEPVFRRTFATRQRNNNWRSGRGYGPSTQAITGTRGLVHYHSASFIVSLSLTSKLALMSGTPTWGEEYPVAPCWLIQRELAVCN